MLVFLCCCCCLVLSWTIVRWPDILWYRQVESFDDSRKKTRSKLHNPFGFGRMSRLKETWILSWTVISIQIIMFRVLMLVHSRRKTCWTLWSRPNTICFASSANSIEVCSKYSTRTVGRSVFPLAVSQGVLLLLSWVAYLYGRYIHVRCDGNWLIEISSYWRASWWVWGDLTKINQD